MSTKTPSLRWNVITNVASRVWNMGMNLAFIPLYIRLMGIESWGLVGLCGTLQAVFGLLDMGLSATLNRELARAAARPDEDTSQRARDLLRSLEAVYWGLALVIGVTAAALAPAIATHWVKADQLSPETVSSAILVMALMLALRWPTGLYEGGLLGLQRQVARNVIVVTAATVRGVGSILVLKYVSPTVHAFLAWQALTSGLQTVATGWQLWRSVPPGRRRPRASHAALAEVWKFASGMFAISVTVLLFTQMDKLLLSRILSLSDFGYYVLAGTVGLSVTPLINGPIFDAFFPRLSGLVAVGDKDAERAVYHHACQFMSMVLLPVAATLVLFSREVMLVWTHDPVAVANTYHVAAILCLGSALNGLMTIPYALQLAHGWTQLSFIYNVAALVILGPSIWVLAHRWGGVGAAIVWLTINASYPVLGIVLMHRRLLVGDLWRWYRDDVGRPLLAALLVTGSARILWRHDTGRWATFAGLALVTLVTMAATVMALPEWRRKAFQQARQLLLHRADGLAAAAGGRADR